MKKFKLLIFTFIIFSLFMILGITNVNATESGDNGKMYWQTNMSYSGYNIKGYVGDSLKKTTFADDGYVIVLKVGDYTTNVDSLKNGVEKILKTSISNDIETVGLTITPTFVYNGNYVKVTYTVRNLLEEEQIISIGTWADSQIGNNDEAPLTIIDDSIIQMSDGQSAQFNLVTNNAYGVTDTTTKWIGYYGYASNNTFTNYSSSSISSTDSGLSFSWKDILFDANETKTFSVLFGVGAINKAPSITISEITKNDTLGENRFTVKGTVTDEDNTDNTKIYYSIDGKEPLLLHTFPGQPGEFEANITLTEEETIGTNEIEFYAQDEGGAVSNSTKKTITYITNKTITIREMENGTVTSDKTTVTPGETVTLTVAPSEEYKLKELKVLDMFDEMQVTLNEDNTFTMPNYNVFISAEFEPIYSEKAITKTEDDMTLSAKGTFSGSPELVITKIEKGNEGYNSLITLLKDDKEVIGSYDVSIIGGTYEGELELTFTVGKQYERDTITIYHKKESGDIETLTATVKDGKVVITVTELSPFMLVADKEVVEQKDATPKTGIATYIGFTIAITGLALVEAIAIKKRKED